MKLSVVIPHLNQPDKLAQCLETVCNQTLLRSDYEVIVVDNGSTHMPKDVCDRFNARLLLETEPGPGPARNKGIAAAKTDVLAFIDSDCLADTKWLASAWAALSDPNVQIIGGDVRIAYDDPKHLTALESYESVFGYRQKLYIERMGFSGTGNLALQKSVFKTVGPFAGIGVAEDRDWGRRASRLGHKITYVPNMIVSHPARKTNAELKTKWQRHIVHDFAETKASKESLVFWYIKALAVALSPVASAVTVFRTDRVSGTKSRLQALKVLSWIRLYRALKMSVIPFQSSDEKSPQWNRHTSDKAAKH
jgi:glycosyltransferase involved in cell wall biosynthesis